MNAQDRCDNGQCNAQAYVRVLIGKPGDLLFCAHHYNDHALHIFMRGYTVTDEREKLKVKV